MRIGGIVVRVLPGCADELKPKLAGLPGIEIAHQTDDGFALVIEAATASEQKRRHEEITAWPEVEEALVVFQSSEVVS